MKKKNNPTACIIIIGNEILSGRTVDTNRDFLCKKLNEIGIDVIESRIIKDDQNDIIKTVNETRKKYDYIFTTGGIGPTHDDITAVSIAKAFKVNLEKSKEALKILRKYYNDKKNPLNKAKEKMAYVPKGSELLYNPITKAAGFRIKNVYVMAGIPEIMIAMFNKIIKKIKVGKPNISKTILINTAESNIADGLTQIQKEFKEVEIGSYPFFKKGKRGVNIVLRGKNLKLINNAREKIYRLLRTI